MIKRLRENKLKKDAAKRDKMAMRGRGSMKGKGKGKGKLMRLPSLPAIGGGGNTALQWRGGDTT